MAMAMLYYFTYKKVASQIKEGKPFNFVIGIKGENIQYTVYKLPNGTLNIGRIHGIK